MAVKRPKGHSPSIDVPDVKFVDEMVRLSLAINPNLKHGQSTSKYLDQIRSQAIAAAQGAPAAPPAAADSPAPPKSNDDRKKQTIRLFLEMKANDFERDAAAVAEKLKQVQAEALRLKQEATEQIVDYLTVLHSAGTDPNIAKGCLREAKALLAQLGVTENDILRMVLK